MRKLARKIAVVAVNVFVFVAAVGCVEAYYRIWGREQVEAHPNGLWETFQPYVMFAAAPGEYREFRNQFTQTSFPSSVRTNSLGFNDRREFSLTSQYRRAPNERIVLFTGGSAAWGVGATATDRTIAARMEYHLNRLQTTHRYSVVNLAMGGWIAFQEFIGLQLWGREFDPDWVVVMDGFNEIGVGCGFSQGPGNPLYFATMRSYIHGYLLSAQHPVFYRGWLENELIKHSAAYRIITGRQYVRDDRIFDPTSSDSNAARRQVIPTDVGQSREILKFYVEAEHAMLNLYPNAHYVLSTQPVVDRFTDDFADIYEFPADSPQRRDAIARRAAEVERELAAQASTPCGERNTKASFAYVFGNGAVQVEELAQASRAAGRAVDYYNVGTLFPDARAAREPYFIDLVHLSDRGMDLIGRFYAEKIIAADSTRSSSAFP